MWENRKKRRVFAGQPEKNPIQIWDQVLDLKHKTLRNGNKTIKKL